MHFNETLSLVIFSFDLVMVSSYSYKKTPRKIQAFPPNFPVSKFFLHGLHKLSIYETLGGSKLGNQVEELYFTMWRERCFLFNVLLYESFIAIVIQ